MATVSFVPNSRHPRPSAKRSFADITPTRSASTFNREHFAEEPLRPHDPFVDQPDGFRFVDRIADEALLMQPVHSAPVETLPCAAVTVECQVKQRGRSHRRSSPCQPPWRDSLPIADRPCFILQYPMCRTATMQVFIFCCQTVPRWSLPLPGKDFWRRWHSNTTGSASRSLDLRPRLKRAATTLPTPMQSSGPSPG